MTRIVVSNPTVTQQMEAGGTGTRVGGCPCGAWRPVNGGFGFSWAFSPHLRWQSARLAFQTLSPVTRETLAALAPYTPASASPPPARHHTILGSHAQAQEEGFPSGGLLPPASQRPHVSWLLIDPRAEIILTTKSSTPTLWKGHNANMLI